MSEVADLYYPQVPQTADPRLQGLVIPNPTPDMMSGFSGLLDPVFGFFEQRVLGIPVWAIGLGIGAYFLFKTPSKSPKRAWEDA